MPTAYTPPSLVGAVSAPRKSTIVLIGDSLVDADTPVAGNPAILQTDSRGIFCITNYLLGNRFRVVAYKGVGGNTSADVLARLSTDVLAYKPQYCWLIVGINDVTNSISATTTIANLTSIITTLITNGIVPIVHTLPVSTFITTNAQGAAYVAINAWLRDYARTTSRVILVDADWVYVDTAQILPAPLAGYTDNVHPFTNGALKWALRAYTVLNPLVPSVPIFSNAADPTAYATNPEAFVTNPLQLGTGGTLGTGVAGSVASGWTAAVNTAPAVPGSVAASKLARTDAPGEWQVLAFTGANFVYGNTGVIYNTTAAFNLPSGVNVGDTVYAIAEIAPQAGQTGYLSCDLRLRFNGAPGNASWAFGYEYGVSGASFYVNPGQDVPAGVVATPECTVPVGCTAMSVFMHADAIQANASYTIRVGRVQVCRIPPN